MGCGLLCDVRLSASGPYAKDTQFDLLDKIKLLRKFDTKKKWELIQFRILSHKIMALKKSGIIPVFFNERTHYFCSHSVTNKAIGIVRVLAKTKRRTYDYKHFVD